MTISDIVTSIYRRTKTNSASYDAASMLIDINNAYDHVAALIIKSDHKWQWDDTNNTDFPIATTALVSGQQDYALTAAHLTIDRVEVLNSSGTWIALTQIDQQELKRDKTSSLSAYAGTNGAPTEYDLLGSSIFLYPIPNYSLAAALKIYYSRGPASFTSAEVTTGTKIPGFNTLFHDLIPLWVAYNYALENGLGMASGLFASIQVKEKQLEEFYGLRDRDMRGGFRISSDSNK